jgi:hypothetical protein
MKSCVGFLHFFEVAIYNSSKNGIIVKQAQGKFRVSSGKDAEEFWTYQRSSRKYRVEILTAESAGGGLSKHFSKITGYSKIPRFLQLFVLKSWPLAMGSSTLDGPTQNETLHSHGRDRFHRFHSDERCGRIRT